MTLSLRTKTTFGITALVTALVMFAAPVAAQFDPLETICEDTPSATVCQERVDPGTDPVSGDDGILMRVINIMAMIVAVISVIIIIIAGITMTLSAGDSNKVASSRNAIIYALVGLAVIAVSRSIVIFVINRVQ